MLQPQFSDCSVVQSAETTVEPYRVLVPDHAVRCLVIGVLFLPLNVAGGLCGRGLHQPKMIRSTILSRRGGTKETYIDTQILQLRVQ